MPEFTAAQSMRWTFPIPRTHCGVPLGNGNLGILVWGGEHLHLTINKADFWDHRNGEVVPAYGSYEKALAAKEHEDFYNELIYVFNPRDRLPPQWKSSRLPFGRFELVPATGWRLCEAILQLDSGLLRIVLRDAEEQERELALLLAMDDDLVLLDDPDGLIAEVIGRSAWEWEKCRTGLAAREIAEAQEVQGESLTGWVQELPKDPAMAGVCRQEGRILALAVTRGGDAAAAVAAAEAVMERYLGEGFGALQQNLAQWWGDYWAATPRLELPDAFLDDFFRFALYKFGCATSPSSSTASGLQGPWAEEYQMTPWNGDYHFNVNVQQIYTFAVHANHPEHLLPLFDMLESEPFFGVMRQTAKRLYDVDDGLVITHAVDDRGRQVGGLGVGAIIDQACGGWAGQLYWLYYQYTGDLDFLRERAYPMLRGFLRAYEGMLRRDGDHYELPMSISAEYRVNDDQGRMINWGANPSYQLACIHMLVDALLEASDRLDIEPPARWHHLKQHLPLYTTIEDGAGARRLAIWEGQDLDVCHRHHSHLACLYPFDSLGELTAEHQQVLDDSIDRWIAKGMGEWSEWCIPWAAILQARMGFTESPWLLLQMWREVYVNEGWATVYLPRFRGLTAHRRADLVKPKETHEVMQLDGTMGGATAICELLAHRRHGTVHLFPGVPEAWREVSFANLRLPGPLVMAAERREGRTVRVDLQAQTEGPVRLAIADRTSMTLERGGDRTTIMLPAELSLKAGELVTLSV